MFTSGFDVSFVVAANSGSMKPLLNSQIKVFDAKCERVFLCLPFLLKVLRTFKSPHLVTTMYHCNLVGCVVKLFMSNLKLTIRESTSLDYYQRYSSRIFIFFLFLNFKIFYRVANEIIFPSKDMLKAFTAKIFQPNDKKFRVIPNDFTELEHSLSASEAIPSGLWRRRFKTVLLNVGRLDFNKNQKIILEALSHLKSFSVELLLVGDGKEKNNLEKLAKELNISDQVTFVGFQENPFKFFKAADIYVLSSLVEGYPNSLVQAKYFKMKIVALNCPTGPSEILADYRESHIVELSEANLGQALAEKIKLFLT